MLCIHPSLFLNQQQSCCAPPHPTTHPPPTNAHTYYKQKSQTTYWRMCRHLCDRIQFTSRVARLVSYVNGEREKHTHDTTGTAAAAD